MSENESETSDWSNVISAIIGSLALAGIIGGITTWNKGEMTSAQVSTLEEHLHQAGEDRFTGTMGLAIDVRIRELETAKARTDVRLDHLEGK